MRRNLIILFITAGFIFSCSAEKEEPQKNQLSIQDEEQEYARKTADTLELSDTLTNQGKVTMNSILEAFTYCKETAENPLQCKYFVAKAIDDYFGVKDFMSNGTYVDFENILFMVRSNSKWRSLGQANSQQVLDQAQALANKGKPVLAIQTNTKYGHIVIVLPGKTEKAPNWGGLSCPIVASFFMVQDHDSFVDKSMAFAWSSPEGVEIFARD
jgi:hypothetical protein